MSYALLLKESGEGCDYTFGCGWKPIAFNHYPTDAEIGQVIKDYGLIRFESITVVKIETIISQSELLEYLPEDDDDDGEDAETAERRAQYERLKREFG